MPDWIYLIPRFLIYGVIAGLIASFVSALFGFSDDLRMVLSVLFGYVSAQIAVYHWRVKSNRYYVLAIMAVFVLGVMY